MKAISSLPVKKSAKKDDRKRKVLLGLVDFYISTGKPVGSSTLQETEFGDISSATIRNYFAQLEEEGFLKQQHISGGRIPTDAAYQYYAAEYYEANIIDRKVEERLRALRFNDNKEISQFLENSAEVLSSVTNTAVFLTAPRFDHDFILSIKLVEADSERCVAVLLTNFGLIRTEVLYTPSKLSTFTLHRLEEYFYWRLTGLTKPENLTKEEELLGQQFYSELMTRFIVNYAYFKEEEIYRTGFSRLFTYPELCDPTILARALAIFENSHSMRLLLRECQKMNKLKYWIGQELSPFSHPNAESTVIAMPYYINTKAVGAVGILGPTRLPYRHDFAILRVFSEYVSKALADTVYKFKITCRQPESETYYLKEDERKLLTDYRTILLEDKRGV